MSSTKEDFVCFSPMPLEETFLPSLEAVWIYVLPPQGQATRLVFSLRTILEY